MWEMLKLCLCSILNFDGFCIIYGTYHVSFTGVPLVFLLLMGLFITLRSARISTLLSPQFKPGVT